MYDIDIIKPTHIFYVKYRVTEGDNVWLQSDGDSNSNTARSATDDFQSVSMGLQTPDHRCPQTYVHLHAAGRHTFQCSLSTVLIKSTCKCMINVGRVGLMVDQNFFLSLAYTVFNLTYIIRKTSFSPVTHPECSTEHYVFMEKLGWVVV